MRIFILLFFSHCFLRVESHYFSSSPIPHSRNKREATGALHIVNNHAQPIHEEVKPEGPTTETTEKPCPEKIKPSYIEMGSVFQVVPPKDGVWFEGQSLRKSLPLTNKLDLVRSISRFITLFFLLLSGVVEFYPMIQHLYNTIQSFMVM